MAARRKQKKGRFRVEFREKKRCLNGVPASSSIRIVCTRQDETVWLTQEEMSELFQKAKSTINEHIKNIYSEGELQKESTMRKSGISEFSTKPTNYYNLDDVISFGYRVKSQRGVQFRIWVTNILKEYIKKGVLSSGAGNLCNKHRL